MQDFEKLGQFYLGRTWDADAGRAGGELVLYDARDLTTHAVCVGMTGSGKTGLCVALMEEALIDRIPVIAIDPKGDLGNLLLAFPGLKNEDFRPWIDEAEAARQGIEPDELAARTAESWRNGLAEWGQTPERIAKLKESAEFAIYTPGSRSGRPLAILRSLAAPPAELAADHDAMRDRVMSAVSGLLGLLGVDDDPLQSREHILLSQILDQSWRAGRDVDLAGLIQAVQKPPFEQVGVFDLETFFPAKERLGLAMRLNNLLASPGFAAWREGEPLDIQRLLQTEGGKPRLSILSIAHLNDAERMFFVTMLLNEVVAWMRRQGGTSSLRALLYMDEIYGYFPPTAMPPSKGPMLTLLKQARAFGLGVVLSTQNPVDLDYKGLANIGTWWIGRLQTERDKMRILEGLESASAGGAFDRAEMERILSNLGKRVFLMRNVHEDEPVLFQTRWALTYLRGPMTLPQIQQVTATLPPPPAPRPVAPPVFTPAPAPVAVPDAPPAPANAPAPAGRPVLPPDVPVYFVRGDGAVSRYEPRVAGVAQLHFVDAKSQVDLWTNVSLLAPFSEDGFEAMWSEAELAPDLRNRLDREPAPGASFDDVPAGARRAKTFVSWGKVLQTHLYQTGQIEMFRCPELRTASRPGESEGDFRARLQLMMRERRDEDVRELRDRYAPKAAMLQERLRRAEQRIERERQQVSQQKAQTAISFGATLLGALFGRKVMSAGNVGRTATTIRSASRVGREKEDVERATEDAETLRQQLADLKTRFEAEAEQLTAGLDAAAVSLRRFFVKPRKADINIQLVALAWVPR